MDGAMGSYYHGFSREHITVSLFLATELYIIRLLIRVHARTHSYDVFIEDLLTFILERVKNFPALSYGSNTALQEKN